MLHKWLNGHLTEILTTALAFVLSAAAIGSWSLVFEIREWQKDMETDHGQYEHRLDSAQRDRRAIKRRIRWLEQNRDARLTIWGEK